MTVVGVEMTVHDNSARSGLGEHPVPTRTPSNVIQGTKFDIHVALSSPIFAAGRKGRFPSAARSVREVAVDSEFVN
jgi:hypothetical protein